MKIVRKANLGKEKKAKASLSEAKGKVEKSQELWVQKASRRSGRKTKEKVEKNMKDAESEVSRLEALRTWRD